MRHLALLLVVAGSASAGPDTATQLTFLSAVSDPTWSPDGTEIAFSYDFDIWTVSATGGTPMQITTDATFDFDPAWSPDGSQIAFFRDADIVAIDVATGIETPLANTAADEQFPCWSPAGNRIAFAHRTGTGRWEIWIKNIDNGNTFPVVQQSGFDTTYPAWSPDGRTIAFEARDGSEVNIGIVDLTTGDVSPLIELPTSDAKPAWSPSGGWLVWESERDAFGVTDSDIWMAPFLDGTLGTAVPISCSDEFDATPQWSPNGDTVVFISQRGQLGGQFDLWTLGADVVTTPDATTAAPVALRAWPNPFRAGEVVEFAARAAEHVDVVDATGRLVRRVRAVDGSFAWDGRSVAGHAVAPGVYYVRVGSTVARVVHIR